MYNFQKWEIWEADVPYREDPLKSSRRPVLIISPNEVLILKMTTHHHSEKPKPYEYEIAKWLDILYDRFIKLGQERFSGKQYGRLQMTDIIGVQYMLQYHGLITK